MKYVLDSIDYYKSIHKLESVHIYLASFREHHAFIAYQKKGYEFIKTIGSAKHLIEHLVFYQQYMVNNALKNKTNTNSSVEIDQKIRQSFSQVKLFLKGDDLLVVKCELKAFNQLLIAFNALINTSSKNATSSSLLRHLIWMPETTGQATSQINEHKSSLISNVNKVCGTLKIYILNWLLNLDVALNKIIDKYTVPDSKSEHELALGKFSLKLLTSFNVKYKAYSHGQSWVISQID